MRQTFIRENPFPAFPGSCIPIRTLNRKRLASKMLSLALADLEELAAVADQCAGAYVRVRYRVDEEYARQIDRNQNKEILGASIDVLIEGEILPIQRQRCAGITRMATADRFAKWCELTSTPIAGLLEKVDMLSQAPAEAVADAIIRKEGNDIPCEAECDFLI